MAWASYRDGSNDAPSNLDVVPVSDVKPCNLIVRCLLEQTDENQWQAFSLEFGLAAQAESEVEVREKLESMIDSYLRDALIGEDREHADVLLRRRATWTVFLRYHLASFINLFLAPQRAWRAYKEPLRLQPCAA